MDSKLFILGLLIVFVCGCMCGGSQEKTEGEIMLEQQNNRQDIKEEAADAAMDVSSAIASGIPYKCTYTSNGAKTEVWVKGNLYKVKTSYTGKVFYSINDGQWVYTWQNGMETGSKMLLADFEEKPAETGHEGVPDMQEIKNMPDVKCRPAAVSESFFKPPADLEFTNLGEMMKSMGDITAKTPGDGKNTDMCAVCNMIPDAEPREQCLKSCKST